MTTFESPEIERRRSVRTRLAVPVRVQCQSRIGEELKVEAETHTVSDTGCLIYLEAGLSVGQALVLFREKTGQSMKGRVVSAWRHPGGKIFVGVEFLSASQDFWRDELQKLQTDNPPHLEK